MRQVKQPTNLHARAGEDRYKKGKTRGKRQTIYGAAIASLSHDIDITTSLPSLLLPRLTGPSAEQVIDAARVAHARSRSAGRLAVGARARHGPQHWRRAEALLRRGSVEHRWRSQSAKARSGRRKAGPARGGRRRELSKRGRPADGSGTGLGRRRSGRLCFHLLSSGLLVDPSLELGIIDETARLTELGLDGFTWRRGLAGACGFFLAASEPTGKAPALLGLRSFGSSFGY